MRSTLRFFGRFVAGFALVAAFVAAPAQPAAAAPDQWETFHGCVVTVGDDYVVIRVKSAGRGPSGLHRFGFTGATSVETGLEGDACVAVVAWEEGGEWYAASISAESDGDGNVTVTRRNRGG
ncbi:MAG: hypothetical protein U0821_17635 [Chloroflexota bacterium]